MVSPKVVRPRPSDAIIFIDGPLKGTCHENVAFGDVQTGESVLQ